MSCESLEVDGCQTLVLEVEVPVLLEVAEQGPPGPPGGEGPPGTTDYNDLINKPTLGTAAAKDIEFFATAAALSTTSSAVGSLSTSTSSGLSTATSRIASLSTGLSSVLSTATSGVASLSTSTSSGLSTSTSRINSLSTSTSTGLSTSTSSIASLSTSTSNALSTVTAGLAGKVDTAAVGVSVAPLVAGLVPSIYLPSYVDDVLEFASLGSFPATGETGKIYIALDTSRQYRWGGSAYTELLASPGTTDNVVEGVSNLYFTAARVRSAVLTGLAAGANAVISATDSVLGAFQKLQAQISALVTTVAGKADTTAVNALDAQNVKLTGAQSITGAKSFVPALTGASGTVVGVTVAPAVAQSGTAAFIALDVAPTSTSTGSGNLLVQRWGYNAVTYSSLRTSGAFATRGTITAGSTDGLTSGTSYLNALGSVAVSPTTITTSSTLGLTHGALNVSASSASVVLTLPAAATCTGRIYPIKRIDASGINAVSIVPNGVETIDGRAAYYLDRQYSSVTLRSDGTRWLVESYSEPRAVAQAAPFVNVMSDSGKITARANPLDRTAGAFDNGKLSLFLSPYNGSSAWASVGKFIYDNSTNGGAAGALTQPVIDLITTQGRTTPAVARYGVEWHIAERQQGAGTALPHGAYPGNYLAAVNTASVASLFGAGNASTFTAWVRAIDMNQLVIGAGAVWVNGVRVSGTSGVAAITPAMGWVHVRCVATNALGYDTAWPRFYAETNQKFQIALPAFFLGDVDPGLHLNPLQTINELIP